MTVSGFDELSQSLSADEKKVLLAKIQASLNLSSKDTDAIVTSANQDGELRHRLERDYSKVGFWERLIISIISFFSNISPLEVFTERRLKGPRLLVKQSLMLAFDSSRNLLTAQFAQKIYDLYVEAVHVKPYVDHLFQQKLTLENGLLTLIEQKNPKAPHRLTDLFSLTEMEEVYRVDPRRSALLQKTNEKLQVYLDQVTELSLENIKNILKPLYYLRPIAIYPYAFLFDQFGHNPSQAPIEKYPYFSDAPLRRLAPFLERLFYGLYLAQKSGPPEQDLLFLFQEASQHLTGKKDVHSAEQVFQSLKNLWGASRRLAEDLPWKSLLECCFGDPYYSLQFYLPKFSLLEFYEGTLKLKLLEELEKTITPLRRRILETDKIFLFQSSNVLTLDFYVPGVAPYAAAFRIKGFRFPETMSLLLAFLNTYFQKKILPFAQSLGRLIPPGVKSSIQPILGKVEEISVLREKLMKFDRSLHPESQEGKDLQKLKYELTNKPISQKPFISLIQKKDQEADEIYDSAMDLWTSLSTQLENLSLRNVPGVKAIFNLPYRWDEQTATIETILVRLRTLLQKGIFVLQESHALEN